MGQQLSKQERRELGQQLKEAKKQTLGQKARITSMLWLGGFVFAIFGLIAYVVWDITRPLAGTKFEILERTHVAETEKPVWNSNPPTSGAHYAKTEEWGISERTLNEGRLVHNLEHGGIIIHYKCDAAADASCGELISKLKDITGRLLTKDPKVILQPNPNIDAAIVLSAWGWLDKMDVMDEERVRKFFDDHINRGPERVLL